ncbi:putative neural-cadherin 2 [Portunus trituberculatus]|uniref:Putative neural-cadherin 2 n=1 Tax=Portunus trituberculatus TaxID=210409 RepID=A0A5B7K7J1_PORTR|nr:putative neural-cadherin 2 [Portunus trituberculatus]
MFCKVTATCRLDVFLHFPLFFHVFLCCDARSFFLSLSAVNHNDFQIITGNQQRKFSIDSTTGEVTVASKLNYDDPVRDRNFTMLVRLSDGANQMAETYITIVVINVNDLQPVFDKSSYSFTVTENIQCDIPFGQASGPNDGSGGGGSARSACVGLGVG